MEFDFTRLDSSADIADGGGIVSDATAAAAAASVLPPALATRLHAQLRYQAEQELAQMRRTFWWSMLAAFVVALLMFWNWPAPPPPSPSTSKTRPQKASSYATTSSASSLEEEHQEREADDELSTARAPPTATTIVKASWKEPTRAPASTRWMPVTLLDPITLQRRR